MQVFRVVIHVLLLDKSEFSMPEILCLASWTKRSSIPLFIYELHLNVPYAQITRVSSTILYIFMLYLYLLI